MVEAKPGIAFVEFETDAQASVALSGLQGFKINPTHSMTLAFAARSDAPEMGGARMGGRVDLDGSIGSRNRTPSACL